jgi:hypothetical protein
VTKLTFFEDAEGNLRVRTTPRVAELELFFEQDVQGSPAICRRFLDHVREIETRRIPSWMGSGNAHTVTLTRDSALLQHDYGTAAPYEMPLSAFGAALRQCLETVESGKPAREAAGRG